jgi:hypothetical protein
MWDRYQKYIRFFIPKFFKISRHPPISQPDRQQSAVRTEGEKQIVDTEGDLAEAIKVGVVVMPRSNPDFVMCILTRQHMPESSRC